MFLWIIFLIIFTVNIWFSWALWWFMGIAIFLILIPIIIMVTVGGGLALGLVGMVFWKHDNKNKWQRFLRDFLRGWAWLVCFIWLIPWLFLGVTQFMNNTAAATMPRITISNGEKTVIFQSMIHIASPGFYDDIAHDMENLRGRDFVFFYEWVEQGTPESIVELSSLMGVNITEKMYSVFAQMAWLSLQETQRYIWIVPSTNVDLSTDEIVALAKEANITPPLSSEKNILAIIEKNYPQFTTFQKTIAQILTRGSLNILLKIYTKPSLKKDLKAQVPVFDIILDQRNNLLAWAILDSPVPNIYIHYWALHYAGVLGILAKKDPRWREIARTEFQVIR